MTKEDMIEDMIDSGKYAVVVSGIANNCGCTREEAKAKAIAYYAKGLTTLEVEEIYNEWVDHHMAF